MQRSMTNGAGRFARRALAALPILLVGAVMPSGVFAVGSTTTSVSSSAPCAGTGTPPVTWSHVTLIMFENVPQRKIIGNTADAPYINSIAAACSYSSNTQSLSGTSLADYVALTSGYVGCSSANTNGTCAQELPISSNRPPLTWPQPQASIFSLMNAAGPGDAQAAVEWAESMPANCFMNSVDDFMVQHTPYQYYTATQTTSCQQYARPFPASPADVLSARFNLVTPNRIDIMHRPLSKVSTRVQDGDNWLAGYLPQLLSSPSYQDGNSAILITWDEGDDTTTGVPLIVISPYTTVSGVSDVAYTHYSTLKGIQRMLGQRRLLGHAADIGRSSISRDPIFRLK